jgi:hypothetical protein
MGIDDELRESQKRNREQANAEENERTVRDAARESYHIKEATVASEIAAALQRTPGATRHRGKARRGPGYFV